MSELYDIYKGSKQTGAFGEERSYYKKGKSHEGVDLAKPLNSPINSRYDGTVIKTGYDKNGYGNYIDVLHGETQDGKPIVTRYAHANKLSKKVGDKVTSGEVLGAVGSTGRSTGPHLHTELIVGGQKFNPMDLQKNITNMLEGKMAMQPKGSVQNDKQAIDNVISELATESANAQLSSPELDALKKQTFQAILSKLQQPVQYPKEVTISDILQGNSLGDRMKLYSEYLNTPQAQRNIGSLIGPKVFNKHTGRFESTGEMLGREAEARLNAEKERAMEQEKIQTGLASNAFRAMNEVDAEQLRNDRELARLKQQHQEFLDTIKANKDLADAKIKAEENKEDKRNKIETAQLNEVIRHNKAVENAKENSINYKELVNINGKSYNVKGLTPHDRNAISDNSAIINSLNEGLKVISNNPNAFGLKGATPAWIQGQKGFGTPAGKEARARIGSLAKEYKKYLTGVASNKTEEADFLRYVPAPYDDSDTIMSKIKSIKKIAEDKNKGILDTYYYEEVSGAPQTQNKAPKGGLDFSIP